MWRFNYTSKNYEILLWTTPNLEIKDFEDSVFIKNNLKILYLYCFNLKERLFIYV